MSTRLQQDLKRLDLLAFHRLEWSKPAIRRYHEIRRSKGAASVEVIENLYRWMFVPASLWPFNIHDVFATCLARVAAGKTLDKEMQLLLEILPEPPAGAVCSVVAQHEHDVQRGHYEGLVSTTAKFDATEQAAAFDPALRREWSRIKELWDIGKYSDHKGVIRRTLCAERNLRLPFTVDWKKGKDRFQAVFDAFCLRWNLYGMQGDRPLLVKLSVNLTPHGTMVFIPSYWSFDPKRDVRWEAVMKLHRVRAHKKQGAVLAQGVEERRALAAKLRALDREIRKRGLRGAKRHAFLCNGLGWIEATDATRIARLRKEFKG